eukprot:m.270990 g.270990  ORF g.270990 m.270990 type:complete len:77 (-) comp93068_c0_seq1:270-500(-)
MVVVVAMAMIQMVLTIDDDNDIGVDDNDDHDHDDHKESMTPQTSESGEKYKTKGEERTRQYFTLFNNKNSTRDLLS